MKIVIAGRPTGRIISKLCGVFEFDTIQFVEDIFNISSFNILKDADVFIAAAWNTRGNYKNDLDNYRYAYYTRHWLLKCRQMNVHTIYLGTSDTSGFEDCLYHRCKNMNDNYADATIKIPYVWQPLRVNSLPWKVLRKEPYTLDEKAEVIYVTEDQIINAIVNMMDKNGIYEFNEKKHSLRYWIDKYSFIKM